MYVCTIVMIQVVLNFNIKYSILLILEYVYIYICFDTYIEECMRKWFSLYAWVEWMSKLVVCAVLSDAPKLINKNFDINIYQ